MDRRGRLHGGGGFSGAEEVTSTVEVDVSVAEEVTATVEVVVSGAEEVTSTMEVVFSVAEEVTSTVEVVFSGAEEVTSTVEVVFSGAEEVTSTMEVGSFGAENVAHTMEVGFLGAKEVTSMVEVRFLGAEKVVSMVEVGFSRGEKVASLMGVTGFVIRIGQNSGLTGGKGEHFHVVAFSPPPLFMASNAIPKELAPLVALAEDAADGAQMHEVAVGLKQNKAVDLRGALAALMGNPATPGVPGKQQAWLTAKAAKSAATAARGTADSKIKAFLAGVVGWMKNHLGRQWSAAWEPLGFSAGSLAVPESADERLAKLPLLVQYFTAHPEQELVPPGEAPPEDAPRFTAAVAAAHLTAGSDARAASLQSETLAGQAKAARDEALVALRRRLSGLLAELTQLLSDEDARWYAFGFSRPADREIPDRPELVVLTAGTPGMVLVDWDDVPRAERSKVYRKLPTDAEPVLAADNVAESETTLKGLPSGVTVAITVESWNAAGGSVPSVAVEIVVP